MSKLLIATVALASMRVCGQNDPPPPVAVAGPPAVTVEAKAGGGHGGQVVPVGEHEVEVLMGEDGTVQAWVIDAEREAVPNARLEVNVQVDGRPRPAVLLWDAEAHVYRGRVVGVTHVTPGPVQVALILHGRPHRVYVPGFTFRPTAFIAVHHEVEVPRPSVRVRHEVHVDRHGPPAHAKAHGWRRKHRRRGHVDVHVRGPAPPRPPSGHLRVEVRGPAPPPPPSVRVNASARVGGRGRH